MEAKEKKRFSIFIVEDDAFQAFFLDKLVKSLGYDVIGKASSGEEAVQLAVELKPDVIFMDISLEGEMDGIDAVKLIQEQISPKIIFVTGNSDNYHRKRAEETKFSDYLIKPVTKDILTNALQKIEQ
jgi:CheY-like chemotaxis protein